MRPLRPLIALVLLVSLAGIALGVRVFRAGPDSSAPVSPDTSAAAAAANVSAPSASVGSLAPAVTSAASAASAAAGSPAASGPATASVPATAPASATATGTASAPAAPRLTAEQFSQLTSKTLRDLPTAAALRDLGEEEVHHAPEPVVRAGSALGEVAQAAHDQPELKPQATRFYVTCTQDADLLPQVRALCYSHIRHAPEAPPESGLPPEVVRLSKLIPEDQ